MDKPSSVELSCLRALRYERTRLESLFGPFPVDTSDDPNAVVFNWLSERIESIEVRLK